MPSLYKLLLTFLLLPNFLFAQNPGAERKRTNVWYFGYTINQDAPGLDFNSGSPVVLNNGRNLLDEGSASICDTAGNLLVYGNQLVIYNAEHDTIANGQGLIGGAQPADATQGLLFVPKPGSHTIIYAFVSIGAGLPFRYHVIDMSLDNGKGAIIEKNTLLPEPFYGTEKLSAVHHCNGRDIWVMTHELGSDRFIAYLVTDTGIQLPPIISEVGAVNGGYQGALKFSSDGRKLANVGLSTTSPFTELFNFNNVTGIVNSPTSLPPGPSDYSVSFSPDNSKLYISSLDGSLRQFNLSSGNAVSIVASEIYIFQHDPYNLQTIQQGPDGKIYVAKAGYPYGDTLGVIKNPNEAGLLCNYDNYALYLNGSACRVGLNNYVESYFNGDPTAFTCVNNTSEEFESQNSLVYPNPFSTSCYVIVPNTQKEKIELKLFDLTGQEHVVTWFVVKESEEEIVLQIERGKLNPGSYLLKYSTAGKVFNKLIIAH